MGCMPVETLRDYGKQAVEACKAHVVTPALENVIEANVYLSGVGVDNVNCAAAKKKFKANKQKIA